MQSTSILLPIKPIYVKEIFSKAKLFEYRTKIARKKIHKIYIYETYPVMRVVGIAFIDKILDMSPNDLWNETKEHSGIDKLSYDSYFKNKDRAYAYKIKKVLKYKNPKKLSDFNLKVAPQSFVYLNC